MEELNKIKLQANKFMNNKMLKLKNKSSQI